VDPLGPSRLSAQPRRQPLDLLARGSPFPIPRHLTSRIEWCWPRWHPWCARSTRPPAPRCGLVPAPQQPDWSIRVLVDRRARVARARRPGPCWRRVGVTTVPAVSPRMTSTTVDRRPSPARSPDRVPSPRHLRLLDAARGRSQGRSRLPCPTQPDRHRAAARPARPSGEPRPGVLPALVRLGGVEWTLDAGCVRSAGEVIRATQGEFLAVVLGARDDPKGPGPWPGVDAAAHRRAPWRRSALRWPRRASIGPTSPPRRYAHSNRLVSSRQPRGALRYWCGARAAGGPVPSS